MKVVKKKIVSSVEPTSLMANTELYEFLRECGRLLGSALTRHLKHHYEECFEEEMPTDVATDLVKAKIGYHYQVTYLQSKGLPVSEVVMSRYRAAMKFDRKGLPDAYKVEKPDTRLPNHSRSIEQYNKKKGRAAKMEDVKQGEDVVVEEETSAEESKKVSKKKPVKAVKKTPAPAKKPVAKKEKKDKVSTADVWIQTLSSSVGKKITDEDIAARMHKALPENKKYTAKDVAIHRSLFNHGKIKGQKGAPKTKLEQYVKKAA